MAKSAAQRKEESHPSGSKKTAAHVHLEEVLGEGPKDNKYLPEGFRRHSAVIHKDHLYKMKCLAYWENIPIYQAQYLIMEEYFKDKKIKDMPAKRSILPK